MKPITCTTMKWQLQSSGETVRKYLKSHRGELVEKIERYGLHATSTFGKSAMGEYARPRWATHGFRARGRFFSTWGDLRWYLEGEQHSG